MAELSNGKTEQQVIDERAKFIGAFNDTMIKIWQERIMLLDVYDHDRETGEPHLYDSVVAIRCDTDGKYVSVTLEQGFNEYGLWQDYGTGRGVTRGNNGDIGHYNTRLRRRWFSVKYFASFMRLKEFMCDSLGKEFIAIIGNALDDRKMRQISNYYRTHPM